MASGSSKHSVAACVDALRRCHGDAQKSPLRAVREKYAQVKFKCVSLIKPMASAA